MLVKIVVSCVCALLALCVEAKATCAEDQFGCGPQYTMCISQGKACDGYDDCHLREDEANCVTCKSGADLCDGRRCLHDSRKCNGLAECNDESDEVNCITCQAGALKCDDDKQCVIASFWCNGHVNCRDRSDEIYCAFCGHDDLQCDNGECLPPEWWCNGMIDCQDESDEANCTSCSQGMRLCPDGKCISEVQWCNGFEECSEKGDETNCSICKYDSVLCIDAPACVHNDKMCDGISHCRDGSDEMYCRACKYQKADGRIQCIERIEPCDDRRIQVGDNKRIVVTHCLNETSKIKLEKIHNNTTCHQLMGPCEGRRDRVCGNGQWVCEKGTHTSFSRCSDGYLIEINGHCNDIPDCQDKDDEMKTGLGFKCSGLSRTGICVLQQLNIYDDIPQCADKSDICFVDGQFKCFLCLDKRLVVSQQQVCDGMVDCYDLSDECFCDNQTVCQGILGDAKVTCPHNQIHCHNETDCVDMDKVMCNPEVNCVGEINMKFCGLDQEKGETIRCEPHSQTFKSKTATMCDGRPECPNLEDECEKCYENTPVFCEIRCIRENGMRFGISCVGQQTPQGYCNETGLCPKRHDCATELTTTSIDVNFLCDGITDCIDKSDEDTARCSETRFYCRNGKPLSVDIKLVEDGIPQCSDGSDECPPNSKRSTTFSDQKEMIANPVFRVFFLIMGLAAAIGNLVVVVINIKDFPKKQPNGSNVAKSNYVFLLNLASADFLMAIYLIAISNKGLQFSGKYCFFDAEWRSSSTCSMFGVVCVVATMASSGIMAVMTAFRLITICKPFLAKTLEMRSIYISCACVWLLAFLVALLPLVDFPSGYFVSHSWFPTRFFKSSQVVKQEMMRLASNIKPKNMASLSWHDVIRLITEAFPNQPIKGKFGYYSETSVCMPRLFVSPKDASWHFSISIISLLILSFTFMLVAYIIIYKESNKMAKARNKSGDNVMQKRISRLLFTDFCCWVPICVLSFISVAGVPLSNDAYIVSAGILLPINSAINPLLYSTLPDKLGFWFGKFKSDIFNGN